MVAIHSATQLPPPGLAAAGASGAGASNTNEDADDDDDEEDEAEEVEEENEDGPDDQEPMKFIWFNDLYVFDSGTSYVFSYTLSTESTLLQTI